MGPFVEIGWVRSVKSANLKFDHLITDCDEARDMIFRIPGLNYGIGEIPMVTYTAPKTAFSEAGRQRVNSLVSEGRLHCEDWKHVLDAEPELGLRALEAAVIWGISYPALYRKARRKQPGYTRIFGVDGL